MEEEERRTLALELAVRVECAAAVDGTYNADRVVTVAGIFERYLKGGA